MGFNVNPSGDAKIAIEAMAIESLFTCHMAIIHGYDGKLW